LNDKCCCDYEDYPPTALSAPAPKIESISCEKAQMHVLHFEKTGTSRYSRRIIIGSDQRSETKQGIGGKIDRFKSGRVRVMVRDRVRVRYN